MVKKEKIIYGGNKNGRGLDDTRKRKERKERKKQKGGDKNTVYIKKSNTTETETVYPIIKNVFLGKNIEFVDDNKYDIGVVYNNKDSLDKLFIGFIGESSDGIDKEIIKSPNNLLSLVSTQEPSVLNDNIIYFPMFLDVGPYIFDESPFKREYTNTERPYIVAYIARYSPEQRDKMFKALKQLDNEDKVHGLGIANHTKDVTLPLKWYELYNVYKDYLFGLAMENKDEIGYITEKIMNMYRGGAIPIYWGTSKVKEIFNPDSFIYVNDYESFEKCAEDIMSIANDKERLIKLQTAPIFQENIVPDYSKYYDTPSPQWVIDIADKIKNNMNAKQEGGNRDTYYSVSQNNSLQVASGNRDKTKAYVVNLDERTDRWEQIQKDFKDTDIILERVSAFKNDNGHYGIAKSFQKIVQMAKDNNLEYVIIFEDDNMPTENFNNNWPIIKNWLETDTEWEIFNGSPRVDPKFEGEFYKTIDNMNLYKMKFVLALNFICVNKKAYDKILNYDSESILTKSIVETAIDRFIGDNNNFINIVCYPFLALQKSGNSNIQDKYVNFKNDDNQQKERFENFIKTLQKGGNKTKAYVINLDKRKDRWEKIQQQFANSNIELERISAIENKDGHIGCSLSIQKVVSMAKENNLPTVFFIEDDCKPLDNFELRWKTTKDWLDNNLDKWEIFNGGADINSMNKDEYNVQYRLDNNVNLLEGKDIHNCNWIYINKSAYQRIIDWKYTVKLYPIDNYLGELKSFKILFIYPFLGIQENDYSNINNKVKDYNNEVNERNKFFNSIIQEGGDAYYSVSQNNSLQVASGNRDASNLSDLSLQQTNVLYDKTKGYVINLEKRKDKFDRILKDFKDLFNLERFIAIEHENGHIGCGESHKAIVKKAKDENKDTVLILEDDCKPSESFSKRWPIIKEWLDLNMDKWEVFNGGVLHPTEEKKEFEIDEDNDLYSMKKGKCTQFMYINKSVYDKILEWSFDKDWLYDYGFINTDKFKNLFVKPQLTTQYNGYSNTERKDKKYGGNVCIISYFTVSTKDTPELQRLKKSAEKCGWKLDILGLEENTDKLGWENQDNKSGDYGNFSIKLVKELEYVNNKNPEDIVLFTDAWDVICLGDCKTLYERYLTFNKDIVFGAEKKCSPDSEKKDLYKVQNVPFPYLNSGFFIGKAGVIKQYLNEYDGKKINDQLFWTNIYIKNQDKIALDSNATMCLQTWDTDQKYYQIQDNKFTFTETNTNPIFIHANGHIKDKLNLFTSLIQSGGKKRNTRNTRKTSKRNIRKISKRNIRNTRKRSKRNIRKMKGGQVETLHYITISTKDTPDLQRLINSAKKNNWDINVLGLEMDTASLGHANKKFGMKLRLVKDYLTKCNPEDLLLFTDAWDVLMFGTKEEVIERYKKFNKSIVFNAEIFCWPDESRKKEYDTLSEEFPFLNSGGYIGKVKDIASCLDNYNNEEEIDDQRFWTDEYFKFRDLIALDHKNEIFVCTAGTDRVNYSIENNKLKYKSAYPLILHANGPGKEQFLTLTQNGGFKTYIDQFIQEG